MLISKENASWRWIATNVVKKSETTVSGWRSTGVLPRADDAVEIAKALNTSVEYLVSGAEPIFLPVSEFEVVSRAKRWRQVIEDLETISPSMSKYFCETIHALAEEDRGTAIEVEATPRAGNQ